MHRLSLTFAQRAGLVSVALASLLAAGVAQESERSPRAERDVAGRVEADPVAADEVAARLQWLEERRAGDEAARQEAVRRFASTPDWRLVPCDRYFLVTNSDSDEFVQGARRRLEAVRARLVREYPPRTPIGGPNLHSRVVVMAHEDRTGYMEYGGAGGTSANYNEARRELSFYDEALDGPTQDDAWEGLQGMLATGYLHELERDVPAAFPEWIVWGISALQMELVLGEDGRLRPGLDEQDEARFAKAHRDDELLWIADLLTYDRKQFLSKSRTGRAEPRLCRYQAGVFLRFLDSEGSGTSAWDPRWGQIVPRYFEALQDGRSTEECRAHAFEGIEPMELELGWRLWLERRFGEAPAPPK